MLITLEGHYLSGYGDGDKPIPLAEPLTLLNPEAPEIESTLDDEPLTRERVHRVMELVPGFASPYGLELLATVHWVQTRKRVGEDLVGTVQAVADWSKRKERLFTPDQIAVASDALVQRHWVTGDGAGAVSDPSRDVRRHGLTH